jgi:peptidoglycan glycosyltransferase
MKLDATLRRTTLGLLLAFISVIASLAYWSLIGAEDILARGDNPRRVEAERAILRGLIVDRDGTVLAETQQVGQSIAGKPVMRRRYPFPQAASVVGYYSLRFGVGGVEAAYDDTLRGAQNPLDRALHRIQTGADVRLTIDITLQQAITDALGRNPGAVVVVEVPSGAVRALVSLPSYDPNRLDDTYQLLRLNPFAPLLNRVTQGIYQPGGALQSIFLAQMLAAQMPLDQPITSAAEPIPLNGLALQCAGLKVAATLIQAFAQACPAPFVDAAMSAPGEAQDMIAGFGLLQAPTLVDFGTVSGRSPTPLMDLRTVARARAQAAGQGDLTVTPLQMALVAATLANDGNTVTPYLVDATRAPGSDEWRSRLTAPTERAVITADVAELLRDAMRAAVMTGAAQAADQSGLTIYGHASYAYTGVTANSWFIGFAYLPDGNAAVVAVVLEGKRDPTLASQIGGLALRAAH